jgi:hypothetical protein
VTTLILGFYTSLLTLAPSHTGVLTSMSMTVGILGMAFTPQLVGFFRIQGTLEEWRKIFYILAVLVMASGVTFVIFGSGDVQPWGKIAPSTIKTVNVNGEKKKPIIKNVDLATQSLLSRHSPYSGLEQA